MSTNRDDIVKYVASLDENQWKQFVTEARGADAAIRTAEQTGNWRDSMALKNQQLAQLIHDADRNGNPRK